MESPPKPQVEGLKAAMETAKQIITLSTGVIAVTLTFLDKFTKTAAEGRALPFTIVAAWIIFGLAILFSVWTLMALTGTMNAIDRRANGLTLTKEQQSAVDAYGDNVQVPAVAMVVCFLAALGMTIATGFFI
jgi:hypothetical protein